MTEDETLDYIANNLYELNKKLADVNKKLDKLYDTVNNIEIKNRQSTTKNMKLKRIKSIKSIPVFKNEDEEAEYWDTHSLADVVDELKENDIEIKITPSTIAKAYNVNIDLVYSIIKKLRIKKVGGRYLLSYDDAHLITTELKRRKQYLK